jgi:hypothetical protein
MDPERMFYPDANSTMRLTYGTVGSYDPADAVHYHYVTTANGILQKKDNSDPEFVVPDALDKLLRDRDYGRWQDESGELVVCFLHGTDITGGNSGSPVLNGDGDLIGLAFDGNWEAMSGDIAFEPELQRTISVDIRYVMWIIDKFAGAQNLIDEMDIVNTRTDVRNRMRRNRESSTERDGASAKPDRKERKAKGDKNDDRRKVRDEMRKNNSDKKDDREKDGEQAAQAA